MISCSVFALQRQPCTIDLSLDQRLQPAQQAPSAGMMQASWGPGVNHSTSRCCQLSSCSADAGEHRTADRKAWKAWQQLRHAQDVSCVIVQDCRAGCLAAASCALRNSIQPRDKQAAYLLGTVVPAMAVMIVWLLAPARSALDVAAPSALAQVDATVASRLLQSPAQQSHGPI